MWNVIEEDSFQRSAAQLGGLQYVDAALAPIMNAVESNPLAFEKVPGMPDIRVARTKISVTGLEMIPALRLWLRTSEASRTVYLLYVELAPPEDMAIGDSL